MIIQCSPLSPAGIDIKDGVQECVAIAQAAQINFHEIGLSNGFTEEGLDPSSPRTPIYVSPEQYGYGFAFAPNSSFTFLIDDLVVPAGTYTHLYMRIANSAFLKAHHQFSTSREDGNGNSGNFCYTNGNADNGVTCGSSNLSAFNREQIRFSDGSDYSNTDIRDPLGGGTTSVGYAQFQALSSNLEPSTSWNDDRFIFVSVRIDPIVVEEDTARFTISFPDINRYTLEFSEGSSSTSVVNGAYWLGGITPVGLEAASAENTYVSAIEASVDLTDSNTATAIVDGTKDVEFTVEVSVPASPRFYINYENTDEDVEVVSVCHEPEGKVLITFKPLTDSFESSSIRMGFPGEGESYDTTPTRLLRIISH